MADVISIANARNKRTPRRLTTKQQRFVEEYMIDACATRAAVRAGYSKKTARVIGAENLQKPAIAAAISEAQSLLSERCNITAEHIIGELANIAFSNVLDYISIDDEGLPHVNLSGLTREQAAAIRNVTTEIHAGGQSKRVKINLHNKISALIALGRHLGMFSKKREIVGPNSGSEAAPEVNDLDLARRIAFVLAKAQRGRSKKTA